MTSFEFLGVMWTPGGGGGGGGGTIGGLKERE